MSKAERSFPHFHSGSKHARDLDCSGVGGFYGVWGQVQYIQRSDFSNFPRNFIVCHILTVRRVFYDKNFGSSSLLWEDLRVFH